jgi:hypothetical protein
MSSKGSAGLLCSLSISLVFMITILLCSAPVVHAVRANWGVRQLGPRMEKRGQHEEAAFYYRAGLDFYTSILQLWIGAVYDNQVDEIYQQYAEAFGEEGWRSADHEERWDTMKAYLFFFNRDGATRNIEMGNFTPEQRDRLEDRLRIYIEDLINPDNGFGGDFSFSRKAWVLERAGLFWHAASRRELAGRYAIRVCSQYYAAVADEMERVFGDTVRADLYRQKSAWWRSRGLREFQFCNGDRVLARLKDGGKLKRLNRGQVIAILKRGLRAKNTDARLTSVWLLADMGEFETLRQAMQDSETEVRKAAVEAFADSMYLPGLDLALRDGDAHISATAEAALKAEPESVGPYLRAIQFLSQGLRDERTSAFAAEKLRELSGLNPGEDATGWLSWAEQTTGGIRPGVLVEYFGETDRAKPAASKVFETVDIGMKFQANFPKVWYRDEYWPKPDIFPDNAQGPFRLQITAKLYIPADGSYRFYVKTEVTNRATLSITGRDGKEEEIISPRNEDKLQYIMQSGMGTHRIDFSEPVALKKGLAKLTIVYSGEEVRKIHNEHIVRISGIQKAGIQLFWSSDNHLMELVPAANLFHSGALPAPK